MYLNLAAYYNKPEQNGPQFAEKNVNTFCCKIQIKPTFVHEHPNDNKS